MERGLWEQSGKTHSVWTGDVSGGCSSLEGLGSFSEPSTVALWRRRNLAPQTIPQPQAGSYTFLAIKTKSWVTRFWMTRLSSRQRKWSKGARWGARWRQGSPENAIVQHWLRDQWAEQQIIFIPLWMNCRGNVIGREWLKICCHGNSLRLNLFLCALVGCWIKRKAGDCKDERTEKGGENFNEMRVFRVGGDEFVSGLETATQSRHRLYGVTIIYKSTWHTLCASCIMWTGFTCYLVNEVELRSVG